MDGLIALAEHFILPWAVFVIGAGICATLAAFAGWVIHRHAGRQS